MNKVELVAAIADKAGITKADAERALNAFTETVEETLKKGEQIALVGFGTFGGKENRRKGKEGEEGEEVIRAFRHIKQQKPGSSPGFC